MSKANENNSCQNTEAMSECLGKERFASKGFAILINKLIRKELRKTNIYQCKTCCGWHFGNSIGHTNSRMITSSYQMEAPEGELTEILTSAQLVGLSG